MKILVFGGSGFIGKSLVPFLRYQKHVVDVFSRNPKPQEYHWDPEKNILDPQLLENADVVINLAGENIFGMGTKSKLERIEKSRLQSTELIVKTLKTLSCPPSLYLGSSAVGYYGDRGNTPLNETSSPGNSFFSSLCDQMESISNRLTSHMRVVNGRFGIVLSKEGGALAKMLPIFQMGFGGKLGNGKQMMSWIAIDDFLKAIVFILETNSLNGPINFTSPHPITNEEFTNALGQAVHRKTFVNVPKLMIELIFGANADLFLASAAVYPKVLLDTGFTFQYPDIKSALNHLLNP